MEDSPFKEVSAAEAVQLGAVDGVFFSRHFFPKTCRQDPPTFEKDVWRLLDDPRKRFASFMMFRDAAKTTRCRIFTAKRIAYGLTRTAIYVGKSQDQAARSVEWLLKQIQGNKIFHETFGLSQGSKWTGEEVEVKNNLLNMTTRVIAYGITGSIRGVNVDDYRPDLIVGDDITDEENAATVESRKKIHDLWFGALKESLAPATENPDAKQVLLGTMLDPDDVNSVCLRDPSYTSLTIPILNSEGQSNWPSRYPTETVIAERDAATRMSRYALWMREKMCKWVVSEDAYFRPDWFDGGFTEETRPKKLHLYGFGDYAATEKAGDSTELGIAGIDSYGNIYVIDWWNGRTSPEAWIEAQCDLIRQHWPIVWFGETGPLRRATESFLLKRMEERNLRCRLEWLPSIGDKVVRARGLQAAAATGRIRFPSNQPWATRVKRQLCDFTGSPRGVDDAVDALSLLVRGLDKVRTPRAPKKDEDKVIYLHDRSAQAWMGS